MRRRGAVEQQPGAQQPEYWAHVCAILSPARQRFQRASDMSALEPSVPTGVSRIKAALRTCSATWRVFTLRDIAGKPSDRSAIVLPQRRC